MEKHQTAQMKNQPKNLNGSGAAWWALHGATVLFGVAGLFGKWLTLHPLLIVLGRVVFATLTLGVFLWLTRRWPPRLPRSDWTRMMLCGVLLAFHWGAFFQSIQLSSVAIGLLAYATAPVFTALVEPFWYRERFTLPPLVAAIASLLGVGLIAPSWQLADLMVQGLLWGIAAGASFALLSLLNQDLRTRHDSAVLTFWQDATAALVLLPLLGWMELSLSPGEILLLAVLGVACTAVAHGLFIFALAHVRPHTAILVSNLEPVYGIALAALLLGENPSPRTLAGGAIVMATVFWFSVFHSQNPVTYQK